MPSRPGIWSWNSPALLTQTPAEDESQTPVPARAKVCALYIHTAEVTEYVAGKHNGYNRCSHKCTVLTKQKYCLSLFQPKNTIQTSLNKVNLQAIEHGQETLPLVNHSCLKFLNASQKNLIIILKKSFYVFYVNFNKGKSNLLFD